MAITYAKLVDQCAGDVVSAMRLIDSGGFFSSFSSLFFFFCSDGSSSLFFLSSPIIEWWRFDVRTKVSTLSMCVGSMDTS